MRIACFTGHRKIAGRYLDYLNMSYEWRKLREFLLAMLIEHVEDGTRVFISGMALGFDQLAAECVIHIRDKHFQPGTVALAAAKPIPSQSSNWMAKSKLEYEKMLAECDAVHTISPDPFTVGKMHKRNIWMVENSDYVIAAWDGSSGGTKHCLTYALENGKEVLRINPNEAALKVYKMHIDEVSG